LGDSNGRGIDANNVSENQEIYYQDLVSWTDNDGILCFVFEAFDESLKGSNEPLEPETLGAFKVDGTPKLVMEREPNSIVLQHVASLKLFSNKTIL
jgi:hypothetical protein